MWTVELDKAQAGVKMAGGNINNLRYAEDTTLMAGSEEELKRFLIKVKEESEKAGLKLNIQKTKIREQDGRRVGGHGVHLSPRMYQEYTSDTDMHAEYQLRVDRSTWPQEKNIQNHTKLGRMKELGEKTGVLVGLDLPSAGGGKAAGVWSPHRDNCLSQRRNI